MAGHEPQYTENLGEALSRKEPYLLTLCFAVYRNPIISLCRISENVTDRQH